MGYVYLATNRINGKRYVGQAVNLVARKRKHRKDARRGSMLVFHCAIRKYGFDAFDWKILYYRERLTPEKDKVTRDYWERYYIKKLNTVAPNGYNLTAGGGGTDGWTPPDVEKWMQQRPSFTNLGRKHTEESKQKNREAHLGRPSAWKGQHFTETTLAKMRGRHWSEDAKARITGKRHSEESKAKMRLSRVGYKPTEASIKKQSQTLSLRWAQPEFRAMMIEARRVARLVKDWDSCAL